MGILNYSDDQVKSWLKDKTPDQIAQQAASMGLNADQIKEATDMGGQNYSVNDISGYAANNGYTWGANGALTKQPAKPTAQTHPGGMDIAGNYYTQQQIHDQFAQPGFDPNQWAQQHGITNPDQIHQMATQARTIAGPSNPTGDAAMQAAWQNYRRNNPNGAGVNDYAGFVANQAGGRGDAIRAGTYTGAFNDARDYAPGGIYGPGSATYGTPGYAGGLGSRGDGAGTNGDAWASPGGTPASGGASVTPMGGTGSTPGGGSSSTTGSTYGSSGPGQWDVTAPQTVESRIAGILSSGNPLVEQARARADMRMNSRGLVNSSMAQTASDDAAYSAALDIARPDAATYADAAKTNALAKTTWGISQNNNTTSRDINASNISAQRDLQHATQLYNNLATQTATASSIQSWGLNTITAIQASDISADAKNAAISAVQQYLADSYQIQGDWHTSAAKAIDAIFR